MFFPEKPGEILLPMEADTVSASRLPRRPRRQFASESLAFHVETNNCNISRRNNHGNRPHGRVFSISS